MNAKQLNSIVHNVNKTLFWQNFAKENPTNIKDIERVYKFKYLNDSELNSAIESIKSFDINQVWERKFWGLKLHESICGVATEIYNNIKKIKSYEETI